MNVIKTLLAAAACASVLTPVIAAEEVTLSVTGSVIPGACSVSLANPDIDLGTVRAENLNEEELTALPEMQVSYTTTCPSARAVGVSWVDNKAGTAYGQDPTGFGLGEHNGKNIGFYHLVHHGASDAADGTMGPLINSSNGGTTWESVSSWIANANGQNMMSYAIEGTTTPAQYTRHTGRFYLSAYIAPTKDLDLSENIEIEGNATMSLTYL
ncbi:MULTISPECIES: DUF1120 domain-containing protein [Pseudomonas]|uniref:DUF1120 domain-containing protein n=1 Tax=Pseudomonas quercus TaxID=2722792 RepID=A0ABX0YCD6_9PSED|nr:MULTISPECIES: DUF1120 domain-containing protein [Pseudomonas]MBF7142481.1 DUF1120 domain-containing protein [Pseudomonas sp. LY10J]NJP01019.1 DUF1120 domain-containing protein [Pseudomonas quercus]